MKKLALSIILALSVSQPVDAREVYVSDQQVVTLRSGQGTEYRIVHRGLRSGAKLQVIEEDSGSGYTHVRTQSGIDGWILSRFLMNTPSAREQLEKLNERLRVASKSEGEQVALITSLQSERDNLQNQLNDLQARYDVLAADYGALELAAADEINLQNQNLSLGEDKAKLTSRVEVLSAENERLRSDRTTSLWITGAGIGLGGFIVAYLVGGMRKRRPTSDLL